MFFPVDTDLVQTLIYCLQDARARNSSRSEGLAIKEAGLSEQEDDSLNRLARALLLDRKLRTTLNKASEDIRPA